MFRKQLIGIISLILTTFFTVPARAETVMEKVARTGVLTISTRSDLIPYSYINESGELVGYSIDLLNLVQEELEQRLGKDIIIQVVIEEKLSERIPKLRSGEFDIACDTAFTWERDRFVDFSTSYAVSGIRLLVNSESNLASPESLANKRIGTAPNNPGAATIKTIQPQANLVSVNSVEEGLNALEEGKVDALAGDTVILYAIREELGKNSYKLVPEQPYARYGVACMVAENNSTFLNIVNYSIIKMMQGYLVGENRFEQMVNQWFGPEGIINIDPTIIRNFFENVMITKEQVPIDETESNAIIK